MKTQISIFTIFILLNLNLYSQNTISSNITHNSATISFPNPTGESLNINVFTQNVDDTIAFFEDFSKLPIVDIGNLIPNSKVALNLPCSYTLMNGCRGKYIYSRYGDTCFFAQYGEFITPLIDLSKSNGNYKVEFYIRNTNNKIGSISIHQLDSLGNSLNTSTLSIPGTSSIQYDTIFSGGSTKNRIKLLSSDVYLSINNLSISYTSINRTPINFSPLITNTNSINLCSLNPNTTYYCYIEGRTDTISFKTLESIRFDSIIKTDPIGARFTFSSSDTVNNRKLILRKKSNHETIFADDLFISEYTCASGLNKAIEVFNGTGLDICLKDYTVKYRINNNFDKIYIFSEEDTIKSNDCIVIYEYFSDLATFNNGFYYKNINLIGTTINGDDAVYILKNSNYIDIFGCIGEDPGTSWTAGTGTNMIKTEKCTLRRNSNVSKGIKVNPSSGFPTLGSEWTQIGGVGSVAESTFEDFGRHTMNNAPGSFDSLACSISLGLKDSSYYLDNLEEGTLYEAYLVIGDNIDSVVSNVISFKTGVNTKRVSNGSWNDNNWSKGIPSKNDNAIIDYGQTLSIPQGVNAVCNNLIIKDSLNQNKASFINNGELSVENKIIVEKYIKGYTSNDNGWNLMGVPVDVISSNQDTIGHSFFNPNLNDDLYYWQENYTDPESYGRWVNWKDIPSNTGDFFINSRGYLTSYQNNTMLSFYGNLNNEDSYSILNNATLSPPNNLRGWHLCSNPYPFYITTNNLQRINVSLPSLLDPESSNYTALINGDSIPPFAGFMVQVSDPNNSLIITKQGNGTKSLNNTNIITINVSSSSGNDKTRLILTDSVSMGYDVMFDNRKLAGYSTSPEIYSIVNNEKYSINAIPTIIDSIIMDINFVSKTDNSYTITLDIDNGDEFEKIALFEKANNTELVDFKIDSSYTFSCSSENNPDMFVLKIFKNLTSLNEVNLKEGISIKQIGNEITVLSNSKVKSLKLTNVKGQTINTNYKSNSIRIPHKGVFVLSISTLNSNYQHKIIYL